MPILAADTSVPRPLAFERPAWGSGVRYNKLGPTLRRAFGAQVAKISLDGGYTCPNRDGTIAWGGCTYCGEGSRGMIARMGSLTRQFEAAIAMRKETIYIAYFQSYSSTYASIKQLKAQWREVLALPGVKGLAVSTRPDCLERDVIAHLAELAQTLPVWVELGLESPYDSTLRKINRGHDVACFTQAIEDLAAAGIATVAHLILGLPQDPPDTAKQAVNLINTLPVWGIKLHPFHVVKGAPIATAWQQGNLQLISRDDYITLAAEAVSRLRDDIIVHRLTGSGAGSKHLAPAWGVQTQKLLVDIERMLTEKDWVQGSRYHAPQQANADALQGVSPYDTAR